MHEKREGGGGGREGERERDRERFFILDTSLFTALSFFLSFLFFLPKTGDFLEARERKRERESKKKTEPS